MPKIDIKPVDVYWLAVQHGATDSRHRIYDREAALGLVATPQDLHDLLAQVAPALHASGLQFQVLTSGGSGRRELVTTRRRLGWRWFSLNVGEESWSAYPQASALFNLHRVYKWATGDAVGEDAATRERDKVTRGRWEVLAHGPQVVFYDPVFGRENRLIEVLQGVGQDPFRMPAQ